MFRSGIQECRQVETRSDRIQMIKALDVATKIIDTYCLPFKQETEKLLPLKNSFAAY